MAVNPSDFYPESLLDITRSAVPLTRDQYVSSSFTWILEVAWFVPMRWANNQLTVLDESGRDIVMRGGLEVNLVEQASFFGETQPEREITVSGLRPHPGLNMAKLIEDGYQLAGSQAILSIWVEGLSWESRKVILRGIVREPNLGGVSEPMSFTVRAIRRVDLPKHPLPGERVTTFTWDYLDSLGKIALPEDSDGAYYPIVYGKPGFREQRQQRVFAPNVPFLKRPNTYNQGGGSPATLIHLDYDLDNEEDEVPGPETLAIALVLNGHSYTSPDIPFSVFLEERFVSILNVTKDHRADDLLVILGKITTPNNAVTTIDGFGQLVSFVELTEFYKRTDDPWVPGDELWTLWDESVGSTPSDRSDDYLQTAGVIIEHALRTGGSVVDTAGWQAVEEELGGYFIDTYRDKPEDAWEWISAEILPLIPVGVVDTEAGLSPVLWRYDVDERDAMGHIQAGVLGIERMGQVEETDDWTNAIRVNYRPKTSGKDFDKIAAVIGEPLVSDDQHPTTHTLSSTARYGERESRVVDAIAVQNTATAQLIANWMAAVYSNPWRKVNLRDKQRSWAHVPVGSPVLYSDDELGWSRRLCWIVKRTWDDIHPTITLLWIPDVVRD